MENKLNHIAIIMDGNRRWAKRRGLPVLMGHHAGVKALENAVRSAKDFGIKYISVYAFSTENWSRNEKEVSGLMGIFKLYAKLKLRELMKEGVRVRFVGSAKNIPNDVADILRNLEERTIDNKDIQMLVCFNYGGRREIAEAFEKFVKSGVTEITEEDISKAMYLPDVPDPDLSIRTSGELRLSNFWLWQSAYSEYYFTETLWPDFDRAELKKAVEEFDRRSRRYGE